jgi:hypothetical protein
VNRCRDQSAFSVVLTSYSKPGQDDIDSLFKSAVASAAAQDDIEAHVYGFMVADLQPDEWFWESLQQPAEKPMSWEDWLPSQFDCSGLTVQVCRLSISWIIFIINSSQTLVSISDWWSVTLSSFPSSYSRPCRSYSQVVTVFKICSSSKQPPATNS